MARVSICPCRKLHLLPETRRKAGTKRHKFRQLFTTSASVEHVSRIGAVVRVKWGGEPLGRQEPTVTNSFAFDSVASTLHL